MHRILLDRNSRLWTGSLKGKGKVIPFPGCLAINVYDHVTESCSEFTLDIDGLWVLVQSANPLPLGTPVVIRFYIPLESQLLAEIKGTVWSFGEDRSHSMAGMFIRLSRKELEPLTGNIQDK